MGNTAATVGGCAFFSATPGSVGGNRQGFSGQFPRRKPVLQSGRRMNRGGKGRRSRPASAEFERGNLTAFSTGTMARAQGSPAFPASALCSRRGACGEKIPSVPLEGLSRRRAFRRRREPPRKRRPYPSIRPFVDRGPRSPPEYRAPHRAAAPLRGVSLLYAAAPRSAGHSRGPFPRPRRLWKRAGETVVCGKFPDTLPASCRLQRFAASRSPGKAPRLARERERVRQRPGFAMVRVSRRRIRG